MAGLGDRFLNRELSALDFNSRVLALAEHERTPLLERAKFLAIFASNLDEFYMLRVAGLERQLAAGSSARSANGLSAAQQLAAIASKAGPLVRRHAALFADEVLPRLTKEGVDLVRWRELGATHREELDALFIDRIFPVVTPLAVDPGHPFPYISNLSLNLAVIVQDRQGARRQFARVKVPPLLPRFVSLDDGALFVPLEDVIAANLDKLFFGMDVVEHHSFRVTRNSDIEVEEGAEDLLLALERQLTQNRAQAAVRLEIESSMPPHVLDLLMRELEVEERNVFCVPGPLDLAGLWDIYALERPDLKDEPFQPVTPPAFQTPNELGEDIFGVLRSQDLLVHHPYDSFATTVLSFIQEAAEDPRVLAIKQTLYRTSGDSPIVDALIDAAESGKQVVVLVEIKARFDERANIRWAKKLEQAGCHVVYGLLGLKTHCKLALVVRQEGDRLRRYVHVGTGNYNPKTARLYEDLGFLTSDPSVGLDVSHLFNYLTGYAHEPSYRSFISAPHGMREAIVGLIQQETKRAREGEPARIVMKLNNLVDAPVIEALYEASDANVQIDLIVRSICSLRPGVQGLSENIRVRSVLGRFLEHSRIFYWRDGGDEKVYIGSADMMERNLDRRVEALVRVDDAKAKKRLLSILDLALSDVGSAWYLDPDGRWHEPRMDEETAGLLLQGELMHRATDSAQTNVGLS